MTKVSPSVRRVARLLTGFLLIGSLVACQSAQAPAAPTSAPGPAAITQQQAAQSTIALQAPAAQSSSAEGGSVRIGLVSMLTGPIANYGIMNDRLMRMAIDEVNAKGGVHVGGKTYRMEPTMTVDDKYTSEGGREAADRLVFGEKVKFILGGTVNDLVAAQAVSEPNGVMSLPANALDISLGPKFPLTLQPGMPNSLMRILGMYQWLSKAFPTAKRVVLAQNDNALGQVYVGAATGAAKQFGLEIVASEPWPIDLKDFNPLVVRIMRDNPDAIDIAFSPSVGPFVQGLRNQGFKGVIFAQSAGSNALAAQPDVFEGFVTATLADWKAPVVSEGEKKVVQAFIQKYRESELELISLSTYNLPLVLAQAMEKAGTIDDVPKIAQTMRAGEWNTISGKGRFVGEKTFGLPAVIEQTVYMSKVQNGKVVTFDAIKGTLP